MVDITRHLFSLKTDDKDFARLLGIDSDGVNPDNGDNCRYGQSIRPVVVE